MKDEKGFTLVELLASLLLLGVVIGIVAISVTNIKAKNFERIYQDNIDAVEKIAAIYDNSFIIPIGGITLQKLVDEAFLEVIPKDPTGAGRIVSISRIIVTESPTTLVRNYILVVDDNDNHPDENVIMLRGNSNLFLSDETYSDEGIVAYNTSSETLDYEIEIICDDAGITTVNSNTGLATIVFEENEATGIYAIWKTLDEIETEYIIDGAHLCTIEYTVDFSGEILMIERKINIQ